MENESLFLAALSACSLIFGMVSGIAAIKRTAGKDAGKRASDMMMVIVKLEDLSAGISEIKGELSHVKNDVRLLTERLIVAEQSLKVAHRRLDEMKHEEERIRQ